MIRWRRFRVHFEEVVQDMKEGQDMVSIATELCFPNIIDNHVADFFGSMLSGEKVARQRRCRHFRYVRTTSVARKRCLYGLGNIWGKDSLSRDQAMMVS